MAPGRCCPDRDREWELPGGFRRDSSCYGSTPSVEDQGREHRQRLLLLLLSSGGGFLFSAEPSVRCCDERHQLERYDRRQDLPSREPRRPRGLHRLVGAQGHSAFTRRDPCLHHSLFRHDCCQSFRDRVARGLPLSPAPRVGHLLRWVLLSRNRHGCPTQTAAPVECRNRCLARTWYSPG